MDRPTHPVPPRLLLGGVLAPLLVGAFVPPLAELATIWFFCGLGAIVFTSATAVVRGGAQPRDDEQWAEREHAADGEQGTDREHGTDREQWADRERVAHVEPATDGQRHHAVPVRPGSWWRRPVEDPNVEAARAGSWG